MSSERVEGRAGVLSGGTVLKKGTESGAKHEGCGKPAREKI